MSISKNYTLKKIKSLLRILTRQLGVKSLQDKEITSIVNYNLLDLAALLNGAQNPFYQDKTVLADAASSASTPVIASASYANATKRITHTGHGITSADIGKRIALLGDSGLAHYMGIGTVTAIISTSIFEVSFALGADIAINYLSYVVLPAHSSSFLDLSTLKIHKIVKLVDSINGEVAPAGDSDFEKLADFDEYSESVCYNHVGETLELFKGSDVASWGTLTLHYYRTPNLLSADTDYVDLKDDYIGLLIDKCKLVIYEIAKQAAPQDLSNSVLMKTKELIQSSANQVAGIEQRAHK